MAVMVLVMAVVAGMIVHEVRSLTAVKGHHERTAEPVPVHDEQPEGPVVATEPPRLVLEHPAITSRPARPLPDQWYQTTNDHEDQGEAIGLDDLLGGLGPLELTEQQQQDVAELLAWLWEQMDQAQRLRLARRIEAISEELMATPSQERQQVVSQMLERAEQWSEDGGTIEELLQYLEQE